MPKRPADMSPSSFRNEVASGSSLTPSSLIDGIGAYLDSLPEAEKLSPLSLLLGTCVLQLKELTARTPLSFDDAIEKEKRERSVVVSGLPESDAMKASDRVAADHAKVTAMLDFAELEHAPAACFRMGEKKPSHPRLLKLMFHSRSAQQSFLSKSRFISTEFPNVFIRPSLTKAEREEAYKLRQQLREMKSNGRDVILYAGSIIERSQLDAVKKSLRSNPSSRPNYGVPRTPVQSDAPQTILSIPPNTTKN